MSKKKDNNSGVAFAGLIGLGLGALGTFIWSKIKEEDQEMEQQKQLNLLKQEVNQKNQEIQKSQNQNEEVTTKDSDNLLENSNLYCPISNILMDDPIIITKCGHTFQQDAIKAWIKKKKVCPLCMIEIEENDLKPNYTMKALIGDIAKKK